MLSAMIVYYRLYKIIEALIINKLFNPSMPSRQKSRECIGIERLLAISMVLCVGVCVYYIICNIFSYYYNNNIIEEYRIQYNIILFITVYYVFCVYFALLLWCSCL